jgi:hypothetical protein
MRLLNTAFVKDQGERPWSGLRLLSNAFIKDERPQSGLKLEEFLGTEIPPYAILSHTWGTEEITFQDITSSSLPPSRKAGFAKLEGFCTRAAQNGYDYV